MIKEFLEKYGHFRLSIQHLGVFNGSWRVSIYNTTYDCFEPIFNHYITDDEMNKLNVDFETVIMTPVMAWIESKEEVRSR